MQSKLLTHCETIAQNIIGLLLAFIVLRLFEIGTMTSIKIQVVIFFLAYIRSYLIRRFFNWLQIQIGNNWKSADENIKDYWRELNHRFKK